LLKSVLVFVSVGVAVVFSFFDPDSALLFLSLGINNTGIDESPREVDSREVVSVADLAEAYYSVNSNTIDEAQNSGQSLNLHLLYEERSLLGIYLHKLRFGVLLSDNTKVHVSDLAPFEFFVIEVAHNQLRSCHSRQKLFFGDFIVLTVTLNLILLLLRVVGLNVSVPLLSDTPHDFLFLSVQSFVLVFTLVILILFS